LQRSVADSLATVRYSFKEEYLEPRTGYSLDLAFWLPSSRLRDRGGRPVSLPAA